eukprot:PhM_4_TR1969/c0_g1_i1/m.96254
MDPVSSMVSNILPGQKYKSHLNAQIQERQQHLHDLQQAVRTMEASLASVGPETECIRMSLEATRQENAHLRHEIEQQYNDFFLTFSTSLDAALETRTATCIDGVDRVFSHHFSEIKRSVDAEELRIVGVAMAEQRQLERDMRHVHDLERRKIQRLTKELQQTLKEYSTRDVEIAAKETATTTRKGGSNSNSRNTTPRASAVPISVSPATTTAKQQQQNSESAREVSVASTSASTIPPPAPPASSSSCVIDDGMLGATAISRPEGGSTFKKRLDKVRNPVGTFLSSVLGSMSSKRDVLVHKLETERAQYHDLVAEVKVKEDLVTGLMKQHTLHGSDVREESVRKLVNAQKGSVVSRNTLTHLNSILEDILCSNIKLEQEMQDTRRKHAMR